MCLEVLTSGLQLYFENSNKPYYENIDHINGIAHGHIFCLAVSETSLTHKYNSTLCERDI